MFERIKMRIIQGRQLKPFATAEVLQDHEDRIKALENDSPAPSPDPEPTPEPVTRDLSFTVNDGTTPIKGATVTIGDKTGTTGDVGGCTIKGVAEGKVTVEVSAEYYESKTETILVDSTHTSFTISLQQGDEPLPPNP